MAFTKLGDCLGELYSKSQIEALYSKSQLEALQIEAETDDAQHDEQYVYYAREAMAEAMAPVA